MNKVFMKFDRIFLRCCMEPEETKVSNLSKFRQAIVDYCERDIDWTKKVTDNDAEGRHIDDLLSPFIFDSLRLRYEDYLHLDRRIGQALISSTPHGRIAQEVVGRGFLARKTPRRTGKGRVSCNGKNRN